MIVTRRPAEEFMRTGYVLVGTPEVSGLERLGVPLYMGRAVATGYVASGPWAPGWAARLAYGLQAIGWEFGAEDLPARAVRAGMLQDDPEEFAQAVAAAADLGGAEAVRQLLEGRR